MNRLKKTTQRERKDLNNMKNRDILAQSRGFKNFAHIIKYLQSDSFKNLGPDDRKEFEDWIKKIK